MSGRLIVCPTPIGNLEDITLRVLSALRDADVIACEDTRRTGVLLERYGVQASLVSYHEHNERERTPDLVARMRDGAVVALVSDAGMPLVSDPGYVLVQGCVAAGLEVEVLPGPSAALAALVASALPADVWRFVGFLPRKRSALAEVFSSPETVVAFESPKRVASSLAVLAELDSERPVAVCRELTKLHEEVVRGSAGELAARYAASEPRGEVVLVVGGAPRRTGVDSSAVDAVRRLVGRRAPSPARPRRSCQSSPALRRTRCTRRWRRSSRPSARLDFGARPRPWRTAALKEGRIATAPEHLRRDRMVVAPMRGALTTSWVVKAPRIATRAAFWSPFGRAAAADHDAGRL